MFDKVLVNFEKQNNPICFSLNQMCWMKSFSLGEDYALTALLLVRKYLLQDVGDSR